MKRMKRVLLAGANSFIAKNFSELSDDYLFLPYYSDINKEVDVSIPFEILINFACPTNPSAYSENSERILKSNSVGIFNLIELCRRNNAMFVQISSGEVYGDAVSPLQEDTLGVIDINSPHSSVQAVKPRLRIFLKKILVYVVLIF